MTQGVALGWLVDAPLVLHRKVHDRGEKTNSRFSPAKEKAMRKRLVLTAGAYAGQARGVKPAAQGSRTRACGWLILKAATRVASVPTRVASVATHVASVPTYVASVPTYVARAATYVASLATYVATLATRVA